MYENTPVTKHPVISFIIAWILANIINLKFFPFIFGICSIGVSPYGPTYLSETAAIVEACIILWLFVIVYNKFYEVLYIIEKRRRN
ncbi:MAG: hypothetical protein Q4B78_03180 [Bacillota bacterium]|nr:hypothetical protein [Bacillota bacterium]